MQSGGVNITKLLAHCFSSLRALQIVRAASSLHVLVLGGRRALLKLCFQVFIVLSSADEAGTCRVYRGVWGIAALSVSRVQVSGRRSRTGLSCHSDSLVTVMFEWFGGQSEVNHSSHGIHVWCPVVSIHRRFASEQTRETVLVCVHAQDSPLLTEPGCSTSKQAVVQR